MKTTNREIKILLALLAIILGYSFFHFLLMPKVSQIDELETRISSDDMIVRNMYNSILRYDTDVRTVRKFQKQAGEHIGNYYVREVQETYLDLIGELLISSGLELASLTATENEIYHPDMTGYETEDPYTIFNSLTGAAEDTSAAGEEPIEQPPEVELMAIQVDAVGTYAGAMRMLERLAKYEKFIVCNVLKIEMSEESISNREPDPVVRLSLELEFISFADPGSLNVSGKIPELPSGFIMPVDFVSGEYRKSFSLSDILAGLKELGASVRQAFGRF